MTKALITRSLGAALAALLLVGSARTEESSDPQPYVVLVGISKYADTQIKERAHAEADAKALYDLFTNKDYLGVDAKHIRLLLGSEDAKRHSQSASRENILKALKWVATNARAQDPVIFAFIGNGGPLGKQGDRRCYFAADSTFKDRDKDAVSAVEIGDALNALKSHRFTSFIDIDFKGFTGEATSTEPRLGESPYKELLGDDGSDDHAPLPGRVVFLATNGLTTSLDLKDHGLFTKVLVDGLKGDADKEGYEPDGVVTVDELSTYLDKKLPDLAREFGKTKEEKQQLHFVLGSRANHFVLTTNPKPAEETKKRLDKLADMIKNDKLPAKYATEAKHLLERMPRLEAQRKLRKEYQQLVDGKIGLEAFDARRDTILEATRLREADAVRFAKKVVEAIQLIKENYIKDVNQGEMAAWAIKGLYRRLDEKIPAEIEAKLKTVKDMEEKDIVVLLAEVRQLLGKREDLAEHKDLDITLQRMLSNLDPYTTYIDPETLEKFKNEIQGNFTGIGIQIRKDNISDMLLVVTPIKNSPAYKAGLEAGDIITKITREVDSNGVALDPVEEISTKGMLLSDAVKKILGKENTRVKLTVQREGKDKPLEFEITRGRVEVETVLGIKRDTEDEWDYMVDKDSKIGYLRLTQFSRNSYRDLYKVMQQLTRKGVKGFVLDLRFNPGGLLDSAVKITDLYIGDGLIVRIRPRVGRPTPFHGQMEGSLLDFPMVCMVNGYSASGSEIVSAALQDHNRAYIIGERSYGKGSVQNIQPFEGGEIKLTTATFWRPSDRNLNKSKTSKDTDDWGVIPDQVVPLTSKEREDLAEAQHNAEIILAKNSKPKENKTEFKDKQLDSALEYLRDQIKLGLKTTKKAG